MPAKIRPTRLEVSDRFPMLGFSIHAEGSPLRAEVALGSEPGLFGAEGKARRTTANFYSTRGASPLQIARGEAVFVVPPEVLARFVGKEKLYFGLATAGEGEAGTMKVAVMPTEASPYVSLKGLTGRSMQRVRVLPSRQQRAAGYNGGGQSALEWAGDAATPGMEAARPNGAARTNGSTPAVPAPYDDGFGPMPAKTAAPPAGSPTGGLPSAQALGGQRAGVGGAMSAGDAATAGEALPLPAPPVPRARAMGGGADAGIAIGGFLLETVRDSSGDVTWELDQFAQRKHPNDVAPATPAPYRDAPTIRLDTWPVSGGVIDDISAWFSIDWQYNGTSLGNVRIANIGTNDAIGWALHVRAQIMDDNILYPPGPCAALRVRLHYRFSRSIGSDVLAMTEVHLYGDGTYEQSSQWLQSSALGLGQPHAHRPKLARGQAAGDIAASGEALPLPEPPPVRARAMDAGVSAAIAIGGFLLTSVRDSSGDVTWELDQFAQRKHPNDVAPATPAPYRDAPTIRLDTWPVSGGVIDDISAWFSIDWQYNGTSLGNVRIANIGTNDAIGWALHVRAQIMDDNILYPPGPCAALRVRLHYRFSRSIGSDVLAMTEVHLYGDGTYEQSSQWLQSSALGLGQPHAHRPKLARGQAAGDIAASGEALPLPEPPPVRARAMDAGVSAAIAIGGFLLTSVRDSSGDVTWELDQFAQRKHPNDVAPATPAPYRDAPTIRLDTWPVSGGVIDDISAWFSIDWQYNGTSLGNVRIANIGTNDAIGWALHVRAQIMDDNILYPPGPCAALRVRLHYRFSRSIGSDVLAMTEVHLYGDGTYEQSSQWLQSSALGLGQPHAHRSKLARGQAAGDIAASGEALPLPEPPPVRARAMDAGVSAAIAIGGFLLTSVRDSSGDVTWELDQFAQRKHPNDVAPATPAPYRDAPTIRLDTWPVSGGVIDDISAWFSIDWQYNGTSLGNVRIANIGTNDAIGWALHVRAQIMDDNILYPPGPCAALRVRLHYRFSRSIGSDVLAMTEVHLYGDGTYEQSSQWLQSSALGLGQPQRRIHARALDGGVGALVSAVGIVVGAVKDSSGGVSWILDAFNQVKHPNDAAPANPQPFRSAPAITIEDWSLGFLDEISADFKVNWQYNGRSIANISIENTYVNDAIGISLVVRATLSHDNVVYDHRTSFIHVLPDGTSLPLLRADGGPAAPDMSRAPCASMKIHFDFTWNQTIGPAHKAAIDLQLFGDGTYTRYGRWIQHSFL